MTYQKNHFVFWVLFACLMFSQSVNALPAYSRLYNAKYNYRVNCQLCHTNGGGSAVNDYGRDYLRAGANLAAFIKIEGLDSDQDGILNLDEIVSKSNPGDARSQPTKPGDWLAQSDSTPIPQKELKTLFLDATAFAGIEGSLKPEQIQSVQGRLGTKLTDEDRVPTFYIAIKDGKKYAVAQFVSVQTDKGLMSIAVALDTQAAVTGVHILKNPDNKSVEEKKFLQQFEGKTLNDSFEVKKGVEPAGNDLALSAKVATTVHKAIAIMNAVFGK